MHLFLYSRQSNDSVVQPIHQTIDLGTLFQMIGVIITFPAAIYGIYQLASLVITYRLRRTRMTLSATSTPTPIPIPTQMQHVIQTLVQPVHDMLTAAHANVATSTTEPPPLVTRSLRHLNLNEVRTWCASIASIANRQSIIQTSLPNMSVTTTLTTTRLANLLSDASKRVLYKSTWLNRIRDDDLEA